MANAFQKFTDSLLSILSSCADILELLLQGFAGPSDSFGWLLSPGFHHDSCLHCAGFFFKVGYQPPDCGMTVSNQLGKRVVPTFTKVVCAISISEGKVMHIP